MTTATKSRTSLGDLVTRCHNLLWKVLKSTILLPRPKAGAGREGTIPSRTHPSSALRASILEASPLDSRARPPPVKKRHCVAYWNQPLYMFSFFTNLQQLSCLLKAAVNLTGQNLILRTLWWVHLTVTRAQVGRSVAGLWTLDKWLTHGCVWTHDWVHNYLDRSERRQKLCIRAHRK